MNNRVGNNSLLRYILPGMRKHIVTGLFTMFIMFSLISCDPNVYFPEYIGVNLIENRGFDSGPGAWTIDYGKTVAFAYTNYEDASGDSAGPTGGTSADTNPWRLEIVNLIPNGDFENTVPPAAPVGWSVNGTATLDSVAGQIQSTSLHYDIGDPAVDSIDFDMAAGVTGLADGPIVDATYLVRFDFKVPNVGTKDFEYTDGVSTLPWSVNITDDAVIHDIPSDYSDLDTEFAFDTASSTFTVGTAGPGGGTAEGYIDHYRVTRTDIKHEIVQRLIYRDDSQSAGDMLSIVPGIYKFSLWAKADPTTTYSGTGSEQANRLDPSGITFGIRVLDSSGLIVGTGSHSESFDSATWIGWSQVSMTFDISKTLQVPTSPTTDVIELFIESTNRFTGQNSRDVGSILIASPSLELLPTGE